MKKILILGVLVANMSCAQNLILDGKVIPLDSAKNAIIDPQGNIVLSSQNGNLTCSGAPPSLSLSANPTDVDSGNSTTVTWDVSNATSCTKSGDWLGNLTGSDVTDGVHNEVVGNLTSNSTFSMQCSNSFGSSPLRSVQISINGNPACNTQTPILGGNDDKVIVPVPFSEPQEYDGTYNDWLRIDASTPWAGRYGNQIYFSLDRNKYIGAQFFTGSETLTGRTNFTTPGNLSGPPPTATTIAISECPGDFSTHLNQQRCIAIGGATPLLRWSTDPNANANTYCKLDKNKTYYVNIVHSNTASNNFSTTACSSSFCGGIMTHALD